MNNTEKKIKDNIPVILKMIENHEPKINMCRLLEVKQETLNKYLNKYGIDYKGNPNRKGIPHSESETSYLEYTEKGKNIATSKLREKLIKQNIKEKKCECCGLETWMNKPIPLELHHIDENRFNNKLDNLKILCSNCHMQTHNYSNVSNKKRKIITKIVKVNKAENYCGCGVKINLKSKKCVKCCQIGRRKLERPEYLDLLIDVQENGYKSVGRKYNVSDNTIRNWIKDYENKMPL